MSEQVFIIAEAGVNHNGSLQLAKQLVDVAKKSGADAVKFQTFSADRLVCQHAPKAAYQKALTAESETQYQMLKKLELSEADHHELLAHCQSQGIQFMSTPFDVDSVAFLDRLGMTVFKIGSGEITNYPYLQAIGRLGKRVILSTGMSTLAEVEAALSVLIESGTPKENITILHANTEYPTPMCDVNLNAMLTLRDALGVSVGYSDHTQGVEVDIAAVALGAQVIEKHFTLDNTMEGPDHKASLEPDELTAMVSAIRNIEQAMGNGEKTPSDSESKNIAVARKSIVAKKPIALGEVFTEDNLTTKRPGSGVSPMRWPEILGTKAEKAYDMDELI